MSSVEHSEDDIHSIHKLAYLVSDVATNFKLMI